MSTTCIYCRGTTYGTESLEHPMPEALGIGSEEHLPRGAACDGCNAYVSKLDQAVCNHPHIRGMLVVGGIRGKKGRFRTALSPEVSFDPRTGAFKGDARKAKLEFDDDGLRIAYPDPPDFNEWEFSRGLHKIALGFLALREGPARVLDPVYDDVRRYIRAPKDRTIWHYYQRITDQPLGDVSLPKLIAKRGKYRVAFAYSPPRVGYLNLIVDEFMVALDGKLPGVDLRILDLVPRHVMKKPDELSRKPWMLKPDGAAPR